MKRVKAVVEFMLDDTDEILQDMSQRELVIELRDMLEGERLGMASFGTAGVVDLKVEEI